MLGILLASPANAVCGTVQIWTLSGFPPAYRALLGKSDPVCWGGVRRTLPAILEIFFDGEYSGTIPAQMTPALPIFVDNVGDWGHIPEINPVAVLPNRNPRVLKKNARVCLVYSYSH